MIIGTKSLSVMALIAIDAVMATTTQGGVFAQLNNYQESGEDLSCGDSCPLLAEENDCDSDCELTPLVELDLIIDDGEDEEITVEKIGCPIAHSFKSKSHKSGYSKDEHEKKSDSHHGSGYSKPDQTDSHHGGGYPKPHQTDSHHGGGYPEPHQMDSHHGGGYPEPHQTDSHHGGGYSIPQHQQSGYGYAPH